MNNLLLELNHNDFKHKKKLNNLNLKNFIKQKKGIDKV